MTEWVRSLRLIVSTTIRTDWRRSLGILLEPAGQAARPLFGLWLALLVDGVVEDDMTLIAVGVGGIALFQSLSYAASLYGISIRITLSEKVGHAFDREIATLTATLPGLDHQERPEYQDRLELLHQTQGALGKSLDSLVRAANSIIVAVITLGLLAVADPLLLVLTVFGLPSIWAARLYQGWMKAAEEASAQPRRLARHLRQLITDADAAAELRMWRIEDEIIARHRDSWLASQEPILRAGRRRGAISFAERAIFIIGYVAAVTFTLWRTTRGQASIGEVLLVAVVGRQVQTQVLGPIYSVAALGDALRAAGRLLWLQDYAATGLTGQRGHRAPPERLEQGIALERLSFHYPGSQRLTLTDISTRIPAGSVVALVGENGAGKTSLVKLLCRFYEPTGGRILVDNVDLAEIDVESWRSQLSAAFQDFARLELVAGRTVGVGNLAELDHEPAVLDAIGRAGAAGVIPSLPRGLSTQLGASWDAGVEPSVGQWQKLALGRALMRPSPLLMIFDEPTASLDAPTEHALFERYADTLRMVRERGGITVLVSHRFSTVRMADHILVLSGGRLIEQGSHEVLVRSGGHYAELYQLQADAYR